MTQQPYPPQYPQQPNQHSQQSAPPPQYVEPNPYQQQGYPSPPVQFQQPAYQQPAPQGYAQPQQPPPPPLAQGSIADYYAQPTGGAQGISWKGVPDGTTHYLAVQRDVTDKDIQQEVGAPNTQTAGQPQFYRDGRPKFVMAIPCTLLQPHPAHPDGEARLFIRGQLQEELTRAMAEAGITDGTPRQGDTMAVMLAYRKQGRGSIPQNIFSVSYARSGQARASAPQGQQSSLAPEPTPPPAAPVPPAHPAAPPQIALAKPVAPPAAAPAQTAPSAPAPPPGMAEDQAAVLARLTAGANQQPSS